nr:FtsX-like permease family protein [Oceanococcus sp. HetDA_MAG_MS8]
MTGTFPSWVSTLDRKLLRDLWRVRGQALAIAVVMACGVSVFVTSQGMLQALQGTRANYYASYQLADIIAPVTRAPIGMACSLESIPGVRRVTTRIVSPALTSVPGTDRPITSVALSLPAQDAGGINRLVLRQGHWPRQAQPREVLLLEGFAKAHGLRVGDEVHALIHGVQHPLIIVGLAISPEFVYAIAPGELVPTPAGFGVIWMHRQALAGATDMVGGFNQALILKSTTQSEEAILRAIDHVLKPYGSTGAFPQREQVSDKMLDSEIQQLAVMARVLPPIFLIVAAFLLNLVLSRLIQTEREQIGLMKAFGYTHIQVASHYLKFVASIASIGIGLGLGLGTWMGRGLSLLYMEYFQFPYLIFSMPPALLLFTGLASMAVALAGAAVAVRGAAALNPAVAMTPPQPTDYSTLSRLGAGILRHLDQPSRMIVRHLLRHPKRAMMTCTGIAASMALLVGASFSWDGIRHMIDWSFQFANRQDVTAYLHQPRPLHERFALLREPGVRSTEPFLAITATLHNGPIRRRESILGLVQQPTLARLINTMQGSVVIPRHGLVLTSKLAQLLQVEQGDSIRVQLREFHQPAFSVPVVGIVTTYLGTGAYMHIDSLSRYLHQTPSMNGVHMLVDTGYDTELAAELKQMPLIAGISMHREAERNLYANLNKSLGSYIFFNSLFAGLIAVGVVYNNARISLSERGRELASLRVLGLSRADVSYILLGELALLTIIALPLGAGLGWLQAWGMTIALNTEMFRMPLTVSASTMGFSLLVIVLATSLSALIVRRRIDQLDLIAVLKTRE